MNYYTRALFKQGQYVGQVVVTPPSPNPPASEPPPFGVPPAAFPQPSSPPYVLIGLAGLAAAALFVFLRHR